MELVESYLNEVGQFLPGEQRAAILLELGDDLVGEVEGRAESEGRAPNEADEVYVLAQFGHPLKVAGRYQPPKYLIGPDLYPAFIQTLKTVFVVALVAQVVIGLGVSQTNDWQIGPLSLLGMFVEILVWIVAIVVAVFIALEYSGEKLNLYENWKPQSISAGSLGVIRRGDVITNLFSEGFFLLWWNDVVVLQNWLPDQPGEFFVHLSDAWTPYFWHLNVLFGALFLLHFYVLVRGVWRRELLVAEIAGNAALLGLIVVLVTATALVEIGGIEAELDYWIQQTVKVSLLVVAGITLWDMWLSFKVFRGNTAYTN
jgi:hypothetical protein